MFHQIDQVRDQFGNGLSGWQVEAFDGSAVVPIYSGDGVGRLPNDRTISDSAGNYRFYVADGVYALRYYDAAGVLKRTDSGVTMIGGTPVFAAGVFVQDGQPSAPGPYLWLKTTPGSTRARLYIEDGI